LTGESPIGNQCSGKASRTGASAWTTPRSRSWPKSCPWEPPSGSWRKPESSSHEQGGWLPTVIVSIPTATAAAPVRQGPTISQPTPLPLRLAPR
jgi:hypothetical protein